MNVLPTLVKVMNRVMMKLMVIRAIVHPAILVKCVKQVSICNVNETMDQNDGSCNSPTVGYTSTCPGIHMYSDTTCKTH